MKLLIIVISLIFFIINPIKAIDLKIVYINTDKILNESKAGIDIKKQLDAINKKNVSKFKKIENNKGKNVVTLRESTKAERLKAGYRILDSLCVEVHI